jgi:hypothetical protein
MQTLKMYGASDDLIECEGVHGTEEFNVCAETGQAHATFLLGNALRIHAIYDGCWCFAVGLIDEDIPLPDWPIRILNSTKCSYSVALEIDVPDGTLLARDA